MSSVLVVWVAVLLASCAGDGGDRPAGPRDAGPPVDAGPVVTWYEDVAPITYAHCAGCHREGGVAPFSMFDASAVVGEGTLMRMKTAAREMPPMPVDNDGSCNTYSNARWLTQDQIDAIGAWVAGGMQLGDVAHDPAHPPAPAGLETVSSTIDTGAPFTPTPQPDSPTDDYHCFVADPGVTGTSYLVGYQVIPGDARVVHHVIVFSVPDAASETALAMNDAATPEPGYTCFGGPNISGAVPLALWAPGGAATMFPAGTGIALPPGHHVVIQVHYNLLGCPMGTTCPDHTQVQLATAPTVDHEARFAAMADHGIVLPPHVADVSQYAEIPLTRLVTGDAAVTVYGYAPHMHTLGLSQRLAMTGTGGTCFGYTDRWSFHWQGIWWYSTPITSFTGSAIQITCDYDTMSRDDTVTWGESTTDEMCLAYLYVALD